MRQHLLCGVLALAGAGFSVPAMARVHEETPDSFVIRQAVVVPASPEETWDVLVRPAEWWDKGHTFSGDSANLSLDPRAGGCFCEILPNEVSPNAAPVGSVEHMRVIYAENARALCMTGALGPMQADAVTGVLTIFLKPEKAGTQILWEYVVSGRMRLPGMAAGTDTMLAGQALLLATKLGAVKGHGLDDAAEAEAAEPADAVKDYAGPERAVPPLEGR